MNVISKYLNHTSFYLGKHAYRSAFVAALIFAYSYFRPLMFYVGIFTLVTVVLGILLEAAKLYGMKKGIEATRFVDERFSNGDENNVLIRIKNNYDVHIKCIVIDELPYQFQERKWKREFTIERGRDYELSYELKPVVRGEYYFGNINIYVTTKAGVVIRRFIFRQPGKVKVYPSYFQARRYRLLAAANRLQDAGIKKVRQMGHSLEFEQIKEYVRGDDYRTVNWKATARRGDLMVNTFTDERSQQIYCIVNKGRTMKMPFNGMTLLDYSINASLVLSNVALMRQDKAGLISFADKLDTFIPADRKPAQLNLILEALYRQETNFQEVDFEKLFAVIRNRITQRSLIVLFTNFESMESLERELPSLKRIAHYHLLMVVFFENTELKSLTSRNAESTEDIYIKTIADKFVHEKKLIVRELRKNGIVAMLTTPENLSINTINKYLELKNRQSI